MLARFALLWLCLCACHRPEVREPVPASIQALATCKGDAPIPEAAADIPGARASWVPDPADGALLFVLELGPKQSTRPPLAIFHGIGKGGMEDFFPAFAQLSRSRHVIALDLPGFGRSARHSDDLGPERLARSMDAVLRACDVDKVDLLGHSSGAPLALLFASEHEARVRRLILASPMGILRPEVLLQAQLLAQLETMYDKRPAVAQALQSLGDMAVHLLRVLTPSSKAVADSGLIGRSAGVLLATSLLDYNFGQAIESVKAPTLILLGKADKVVPTRIVRLLDERLQNARTEVVAFSEHVIMEDQPTQFVASVDNFLTRRAIAPDRSSSPESSLAHGTEAVCYKRDHMVIRGSYDRVLLDECHHAWLDHVSAREIVVRRSEANFDAVQVAEGVIVDASEVVFTAGELRGKQALDLKDSRVDIAGTKIVGSESALYARGISKLMLSVTPLKSPKTNGILHRSLQLKAGDSL